MDAVERSCPNGDPHKVVASLQEPMGDDKVRCLACPRKCIIPEGYFGLCRSKVNVKGVLCEVNYGLVSSVAVDPIEKKPLYHFMPGSTTYSIGTVGCNLFCEHCQNWIISQSNPEEFGYLRELSPEQAVNEALETSSESVAFTYNEPTIVSLEWVLRTARVAKERGLATVSVTNGFWSEESRRVLMEVIDAANVDVKAFRDEFYVRVAKAPSVGPVLRTVEELKVAGKHVELTYLIIPGYNDDEEEIRDFARWVVEKVGADTPVHFSRFYPHFRMTHVPPTPVETIRMAVEIARREGVEYVYSGNVPGDPNEHTYCPKCGTVVIRRYGFEIEECNLGEGNTCPKCGQEIPIVGRCRESRGWIRFL